MSFEWGQIAASIGAAVALFVGWRVAAAKSNRAVTEDRAEEWQKVAEAREKRISDLEGKVNRLESDIATLRGQLTSLESLKAKEIATEVALLLRQSLIIQPKP